MKTLGIYHWSGDPFEFVEILWRIVIVFLRRIAPRDRIWTKEDERWDKRSSRCERWVYCDI